MAQIHSENIVVTLSSLMRNTDTGTSVLATKELVEALETVAQELAGAGIIVEVQVA
jgi:hypothetical protein